MYFHYFPIIYPLKRVWPFIWTNLNLLHQGKLCAKFGWNWPSGSGEEDFLKLSIYFYYFPIISPLGRVLHLKKKLEFPSPGDTLCQVWLQLAQWFWRRRWKCEKFTDGRTDDGRQVIRKAYLSFQLRWAKKYYIAMFFQHKYQFIGSKYFRAWYLGLCFRFHTLLNH